MITEVTNVCISLGIHIGHDGGAAIMKDGNILVAISEERLSRFKYSNGWWSAVKSCLEFTKLNLSDFDVVVFSNSGTRLEKDFDGGLSHFCVNVPRIEFVDHHLSHAISAFSLSGKRESDVYVWDAGGNDNITQSAYSFNTHGWQLIMQTDMQTPKHKSLGTAYEAFTNFLGFRDQESGKTMALASYGRQDRWNIDLFEVSSNGQIVSALDAPHHWGVVNWAQKNSVELGELFPMTTNQNAKDISAFIQSNYESAICESIRQISNITNPQYIAISGGVGLNCKGNSVIQKHFPAINFFFNPLCSDAGLPLGNAIYGQYLLNDEIPCLESPSLCIGPEYGEDAILKALSRHPDTVQPGSLRMGDLYYEKPSDIYVVITQMLNDGKILGWYSGRSEFGPRALGGRSIIANAKIHNIRNKINEQIKEREWFRPFGASLLLSDVSRFVEHPKEYSYMIEAPMVTSLGLIELGECVHIDNSSRIQTVRDDSSPYSTLLKYIKSFNGTSILLNTSFNIQEPIVETPGNAIATFLRSGLDALVLGDYLCIRK